MPTNKNEVHVYTKYNHSLAVQNNEISNKTLKRCKIAHCKKVIVMISTKTIYGYSNRAINMITSYDKISYEENKLYTRYICTI